MAASTKPRKTEFARSLAEAGYSDFLILEKETGEKVLTEKRLELIYTIREEDPESISELARLVDRKVPAVSEDLKLLWSNGIVEYEEGSRGRKKPIVWPSHIFIEPIY